MSDEKRATERERQLEDLRKVLATREGRRLLWRYMGLCGVFKNPHGAESHQTSFYCGMQAIGQTILTDVNESRDEALLMMMREARDDAALAEVLEKKRREMAGED